MAALLRLVGGKPCHTSARSVKSELSCREPHSEPVVGRQRKPRAVGDAMLSCSTTRPSRRSGRHASASIAGPPERFT